MMVLFGRAELIDGVRSLVGYTGKSGFMKSNFALVKAEKVALK